MEVDPLDTLAPSPKEAAETEVINQHAYDFVVQNVYEKCKKEKENKKLTFPLNAEDIRVSYYTGVRLAYLERFCTASTETVEEAEFPVDLTVRKRIYEFLRDCYMSSKLPTLEDLNEAAQSQLSMVDLQKLLNTMGFDYRKTTIGHLTLVENPEITAQRFKYLCNIQKFRTANKTIYFLEEAYVTRNLDIMKFLPPNETSDKELAMEYTFYYAVCKKGFINATFVNKNEDTCFEYWLTNTILKYLEPSSVIVMMQRGETNKKITRYTTKEEMLKLLKNNDVPHRDDMHKSQLYDLIEKFRIVTEKDQFQTFVKANGHEILYLPRPLNDLSIGDLALHALKTSVIIFPSDKPRVVQKKVMKFFDKITPDLWAYFSAKIELLEKELHNIEVATDLALEASTE